MIIRINKSWRIETDKRNIIVSRYAGKQKNPKTGIEEENWKQISFHHTFQAAVENLFQHGIRRVQSDLPSEILKEIKQLRKDIKKAVQFLDDSSIKV